MRQRNDRKKAKTQEKAGRADGEGGGTGCADPEEVEDDDEAFAEKMQKLTERLSEQMAKGAELDALIRKKLGGLGYEF